MKRRIIYYSKNDLSIIPNLIAAESIIREFESDSSHEINDLIELFQIRLFFKNDLYSPKWSNTELANYKKKVDQFWDEIRAFWIKIKNENLVEYFEKVDYEYQESFWLLLVKFNYHKKISPNVLKDVFENSRFNVLDVLKQKKFVDHFEKSLKEFLQKYEDTAELILSQFEEEHLTDWQDIFFPKSILKKELENILSKYLDSPSCNSNYVNLILRSRNIKISNRLKLKAKKTAKKLNQEILEKGVTWKNSFEIAISFDQMEPSKISSSTNHQTFSLSKKYLDRTLNPVGVFNNFEHLFEYINVQGCVELVYKTHEIDPFERSFMKSKNEYFTYSKFQNKHNLSQGLLIIYLNYFEENKIKIEEIISYYVNEHLNKNFDIQGFRIQMPNSGNSFLEKIRMVAPEMEYLIKQYQHYIEDGIIDFELLELSSSPIHFSNIGSKVDYKYAYGDGDKYLRLKYDLFSSQSMLYYLEQFPNYRNLYKLITKENVNYNLFKIYQMNEIDYLVNQGFLHIDKNNYLKISDQELMFVLQVLYLEDVISFWHYPEKTRNVILRLYDQGLVKFQNKLFTEEEKKYLNFHLNQKEFTNGLDLRNKYLHGTNSNSAEDQEHDYYLLMKILILVILKIKDDLILEKIARETGANIV